MKKQSLHRNYQKPSKNVGWDRLSINCLFIDATAMTGEPQSRGDGV